MRFYSSPPPFENAQKSESMSNAASGAIRATPSENSPGTIRPELPSVSERRRGPLTQRFSNAMDTLQSRVLTASQKMNDLTGYTGIEDIKAENAAVEKAVSDAQSRVRTARQAYKTSNSKRASTQREVTTLLTRKDTWSPTDLERFTELYRADHVLEGEVSSAQESLTAAEADEQSLNQRLNAGILKRYHEEQIWSDRIRRASTWGTWGLMGMNFLLFVVLQFVAEPWRRQRLVRGVVAEEKEVLGEVRAELDEIRKALASRDANNAATASTDGAGTVFPAVGLKATESDDQRGRKSTWGEVVYDPSRWGAVAADLVSERQAELRMKDVSIIALEGAVAGATVVASIAWTLSRGR